MATSRVYEMLWTVSTACQTTHELLNNKFFTSGRILALVGLPLPHHSSEVFTRSRQPGPQHQKLPIILSKGNKNPQPQPRGKEESAVRETSEVIDSP
ncbi:serine/threonine-protein kinase PLK1-like [Zalophus californianus]|uniref:Serine/threonine-protein kinase PLK1-like n=1 Tax=Zalophus californianus TaxID=9704 RepID=A0A6J2EJJ1_ZALCA|nr:serine/threonine-protein kinase PLK1-like [Zalophus californianus]